MKMENINLIRKIAWSFYNTTGLEWEELLQEALLGYSLALQRITSNQYNPEKGQKVTTFLWQSTTAHMLNYVKKNKKFKAACTSVTIEELTNLPVDDTSFSTQQLFETLSKEAQEIVSLVFSLPQVFDGEAPTKARKHITNILINRGWTEEKIAFGMKELQVVFS
jgi:DNA-directed RNA polymerase specialized sigma24 family protein